MYIKSLMKRFAAVAAAAVISLTIFGGVGINEQPLKNSAVISSSQTSKAKRLSWIRKSPTRAATSADRRKSWRL